MLFNKFGCTAALFSQKWWKVNKSLYSLCRENMHCFENQSLLFLYNLGQRKVADGK